MSPAVSLRVDGVEYGGWKSVQVTRAVDALAGSFSLALADRWNARMESWPVLAGASCEVRLDGETVITGFVDEWDVSIEGERHEINAAGRDRTADLVDCSAMHSPGEWTDISPLALLRRLAAPYGIPVDGTDRGARFANFKISPGETIFEAMERACRQRGLLLTASPSGRLALAAIGASTAQTALVEGRNILSGTAKHSMRQRFARYVVEGQRRGTDDSYGADAAAVRGEATDPAVPRGRTLRIRAESQSTSSSCRLRSAYEAATRAARSTTYGVSVVGWRQVEGGRLWTVNELVRLTSAKLRVDADLLVSSVRFSLGDGGTVTELELMRPDAFLPQPEVPKKTDPATDIPVGVAVEVQP